MGKRHYGKCGGKKATVMRITGRSSQTADRVCDAIKK